jgi:cytoskeletal protein CcmA (bactofilin family)
MWKWTRGEESKPAPPSGIGTTNTAPPALNVSSAESVQTVLTLQVVESFCPDVTHIGKSILIKGELSGSESVYLNGELEGSVELRDGSLTVGPDGRIRANVEARNIVLHGRVDGNLYGSERVELKKSAVLVGDINTPRITIEDGAYLKGNVQIQKDIPSPQTKKDGTPGPHSSDLPSSAP